MNSLPYRLVFTPLDTDRRVEVIAAWGHEPPQTLLHRHQLLLLNRGVAGRAELRRYWLNTHGRWSYELCGWHADVEPEDLNDPITQLVREVVG